MLQDDDPSTRTKPLTSPDCEAIPVLDRRFGSWRIAVERRPLGTEEIRHAYDHQAAHWNKTLKRFGGTEAYENIATAIVRQIGNRNSEEKVRVLDCGTGDGSFAMALARAIPCRVDAVDVSPEMLVQAKKHFAENGVDAVCHNADARRLPFSDNQFDIALAAHILEHVPTPSLAVSELFRVLKPGGILITSLTQGSLIGRWIQLKWRSHCLSRSQGERLLWAGGFELVRSWNSVGSRRFDRCSIVYQGQKPYPKWPLLGYL